METAGQVPQHASVTVDYRVTTKPAAQGSGGGGGEPAVVSEDPAEVLAARLGLHIS
eukprot:COSAG01_NODE_13861_length_1526_cov_15.158485_4_plen_56_part_00